ncbi:MAG: MBOAT family protein [Ruminococcaceae bacterium]|nr:MBOAT family protein [Oscillospiraceae bacterium]
MLFSSLEFLFLFLPLCIAVYFILPRKAGNYVLLLFSLVFYAMGEPVYLFLMLFTILSDYIFGRLIEKKRERGKDPKGVLILAVTFNLSLLAFFKYFGAFTELLSDILLGSSLKPLNIPLPIGISFYTFQSLSYVIDIYRGEVKAAKDPFIPATYVTLFPQLIAGPIVKYGDIEKDMRGRRHSLTLAAEGVRRFSVGLSKKVILANTAGEMWETFALGFTRDSDLLSVWLGVIFFSFQIYFDFSGYSDMAIGLGKIFGFSFPENFNYPYISRSITEFWRRWHITLSSFFRDYLYIPLGGNRRGKPRTYLNLLIVWSLTGLWHGAGLNFLLWGLYYFLILSLEKAFLLKWLERLPSLLRRAYSLLLIAVGWLIFAADGTANGFSVSDSLAALKILIGFGGTALYTSDSLYTLLRSLTVLAIMAIASTDIPKKLTLAALRGERRRTSLSFLQNALSLSAILLSVAYLVNSGYNPFLYFKF